MEHPAARWMTGATLAIVLAGCSLLQRVPGNGSYAGELCTAAVAGPLECGAAEVFLAKDRAKVRVSDFIYDLSLEQGQVEVILVHGRTLVDVWSASYSWNGQYLRFVDQERRTFYRVRFANPAPGQELGRQGD